MTGAEQARRDSAGSNELRRHPAPIRPLEMWRLELPTLLDRRTCSSSEGSNRARAPLRRRAERRLAIPRRDGEASARLG
jgi:hypothetical protein